MLCPESLAVAYERISLVGAYLALGEVGRIKTFKMGSLETEKLL